MGGSRLYRSIIRHLKKQTDCLVAQMHDHLYDTIYTTKANIVIYPISEYTQEAHNYITDRDHKNVSFVLYIDREVEQKELLDFLTKNTTTKYISSNNFSYNFTPDKSIIHQHIYDNHIYSKLDPIESRNNKVVVLLSSDDDKNHRYLAGQLLPNKNKYPIVLLNNPNFKHDQNIGVCNEIDLNFILNKYSYLVDLDKEFLIEAQICSMPTVDISFSIQDSIDQMKFIPVIDNMTDCETFVKNQMVPFLEGSSL